MLRKIFILYLDPEYVLADKDEISISSSSRRKAADSKQEEENYAARKE